MKNVILILIITSIIACSKEASIKSTTTVEEFASIIVSESVLAPVNPTVSREQGGGGRKYDDFAFYSPYTVDGVLSFEVLSTDGEVNYTWKPNPDERPDYRWIGLPLRVTYKGGMKSYQIRTIKDGAASVWVDVIKK
jgi:hypothetical protein